jgi:hypothetical protein
MTRTHIASDSDKATKYFVATINNASEDDKEALLSLREAGGLPRVGQRACISGFVAGVENGPLRPRGYTPPEDYNSTEMARLRAQNGEKTPHYQIYMATTLNVRPSAVRAAFESVLGRTVGFLAAANGSKQDNEDYVTKEDQDPIRIGHIEDFERAKQKKQGERTDLSVVKADIDEGTLSWDELREKHFGAFAGHEAFFKRYKGNQVERKAKEELLTSYDQVSWKPWQQTLISIAEGPVIPRKAHVVIDPNGNSGKSYLANFLAVKMGFLIVNPSSRRDLGFILTSTLNSGIHVPGVVIDIARSVVGSGMNEHLPNTAMAAVWNFVEALHDGRITNTKYESQTLFFKPPHVMIFTNHDVEIRSEFTLSRDRWNVMKLTSGILLQQTASSWD